MIILPPRDTKQLVQTNRGKILGNLWASFCLDLQTSLGIIKASPRLRINTSGVSNQGLAVAFRAFDNRVYAICGSRIFKNSALNLISGFTEDASTGAITDYSATQSDLEVFNQTLCATSDSKLMSKATNGSGTGAWTQRATFSTTGFIHKTCYFVKFNRLYYIDIDGATGVSTIKSLDSSWSEATSGNYFLSIPSKQGNGYTMASDSNDVWIGMMNYNNLNDETKGSSILRWDGISAQITSEYRIRAQAVLALCFDDRGVLFALDSNGALLSYNGNGFSEVGRLPLNKDLLSNVSTGSYNAFVHPNGMIFSRNNTILVTINNVVGDSGSTIKENIASGIWEWSKETGFIHRQGYSLSTLASSSITDYAQNRISQVGALYEPNIYSASASGKPTLISGATVYSDASTTLTGIFVDDPLDTIQKFASFTSTWIQSQNLKDNWQKVAIKYRQLLNAADKIWIKYRLTEADAVEFTLTWAGLSPTTTTFTTTTDLSALKGYEVEVLQGTGSGKCAHIASASFAAGTCTVVLDEPYTGVTTGTAKARYQAWVKTLTVADQSTESAINSIVAAKPSERIQIKVCMQFTGKDEVHEAVLINAPHTTLQ